MRKFTTITENTLRAIIDRPRDVPTVVGSGHSGRTDHHSDKMATTTNSLISTKISTTMKMLSLNCQLLYVTHTYVHM